MSELDNPYQASSAKLVEDPSGWEIQSAGKWRRFFNFVIDSVLIYASFAVIGVIAVLVGQEWVIEWAAQVNVVTDLLMTAAVRIIYYSVFESLLGFSIGKLITNTRVVDAYGNPISFGTAFVRSLCRHIPFEPLSLLLSDSEIKRGWHDSLSKTYVVVRGTRASRPASVAAQYAEAMARQPMVAVGAEQAAEDARRPD